MDDVMDNRIYYGVMLTAWIVVITVGWLVGIGYSKMRTFKRRFCIGGLHDWEVRELSDGQLFCHCKRCNQIDITLEYPNE
jgi:hypothetical protein